MINWKNERIWRITSIIFGKLNSKLLFKLGYAIVFKVNESKWIIQRRDNP